MTCWCRWWIPVVFAACSYRPPDPGGLPDGVESPSASPRRLVFSSPDADDTIQDVPILIALDATRIDYAQVTNPATDLRFHDEDTATDLPFEIETWNPAGESAVWVRVPQITAAPRSILMFFGASAAGSESVAAVWAGYDLVHHFGETLTSSTRKYDGTATNATVVAGHIANAVQLSGAPTSRIEFDDGRDLFDGWSAFTLELWLYADYPSAASISGEARIMHKGTSLALGRLFTNGSEVTFQVDMHFTNGNDEFVNTQIPLQTWTHLAYVFDGDRLVLYKNGLEANDDSMSGSNNRMLDSTQAFFLGGASGSTLAGMIDELRITQTARNADFMLAQHLSMTRQLVTFEDP